MRTDHHGRRGVAAFDFDGTIAKGDSLLPFLKRAVGRRAVAGAVFSHLPQLLRVKLTNTQHGKVKEKFIETLLAGKELDVMQRHAQSYAQHMVETQVFTQAKERIAWHKAHGHETIMVSASPDIYLKPTAELLGIDHAITTSLEVNNGRLTGRFVGNNVRDTEKERLLRDYLNNEPVELWAYGNSDGDKQMLAMADHPYWANSDGVISPLQ